MRRVAIILKRYGEYKLTQEDRVGFLYNVLSVGDMELAKGLHSSGRTKSYTFASKETLGDTITFYFSSLNPEITAAFKKGAEELVDNGNGFIYGDCVYKITDVIGIPDLQHIPKSIRVKTMSPITLYRASGKTRETRKKVNLVYTPSTKKEWLKALKKNLLKRTGMFTDTLGKIKFIPLNNGSAEWIDYHNGRVIGQHLELRLTGSREALECAIYGGLGEKTGVGFGMVIPC